MRGFISTMTLMASLASSVHGAPLAATGSRGLQMAETMRTRSDGWALAQRQDLFDDLDDNLNGVGCDFDSVDGDLDVDGNLDTDDDLNPEVDLGADVDASGSCMDASADLDLGLWDEPMAKRQVTTPPTDAVPDVPAAPAAPTLTLGTLLQVLGLDLQTAFDTLASEGLDLSKLGINVTSILATPIDLLGDTPPVTNATEAVTPAATPTTAPSTLAARQNTSVDLGAILSALGISPQALEDSLKDKGIDLAGLGIDLDSIYGITSSASAPAATGDAMAPLTGDAATAMADLTSPTKRATIDLVALLKALGIDLSGLGIDLGELSSVEVPQATPTA